VTKRVERIGESVIVYDDELASQITEAWFEPSHWTDVSAAPDGGRGQTLFVKCNQQDWVIRHYYRGGMARRILVDEYIWLGAKSTRSFREWALLEHMISMDLPVPHPVAGRFVRRGIIYTADLITVRIPDVKSFARRLVDRELSTDAWRSAGELVRQFHQAGIYHADLNAHNIQVNKNDEMFLLDFDRGSIRSAPGAWSERNLKRLKRSLGKISNQHDVQFSAQEWNWLLAGYRAKGA
jgi:3-deoxy-D-manno-octulosonic acid kinase